MQYNVSKSKIEKINLNSSSNNNNISFKPFSTSFHETEPEQVIYDPEIYVDNDYTQLRPYKPASKYSNTEHSDSDNICINQFRNLMNDIQNELNDQEYLLYTKYFEGKKIAEMLDKNNELKQVEYEQFKKIAYEEYGYKDIRVQKMYDKINKTIRDYNKGKHSIDISSDLKNYEYCETITTENGYDAMVFKNENGNYMIVNSCTNAKSLEDLCAIAYTMNLKAFGGNNDFISVILDDILVDKNIGYTKGKNIDIDFCKQCFEGQVKDNTDLIKKYAEMAAKDGKKVELYGYSLGGGIQESAFYNVIDDKEIYDNVSSITVYNPFTLYLEQYTNYSKESIFSKPFKYMEMQQKLLIYSAEEDVVSTLNNLGNVFEDKTVYLKADNINSDSIKGFKDFYGYIINGKGNHGYVNLDKDAFDEYGNIIELGEFKPIHETLGIADKYGKDNIFYVDKEKDYSPRYDLIINKILHLDTIDEKIENMNDKYPGVKKAYNKITKYISNNFGNYNYDEFADTLTNSLWIVIEKKIEDKTWIFDGAVDFSVEDNFKNSFRQFLKDSDNKEQIIEVIKLILMKREANEHEAEQISNDIKDILYELKNKYDDYYSDEFLGGVAVSSILLGPFNILTLGYEGINVAFLELFDDNISKMIDSAF